ncbi:Gfo/Idh/MocA family protein [Arthrobacter sp. GMC3]|uniref:Gfo/Idh/MocA family protein n=1 Tax=Arthrobacter sp. GMC3 TaxID=2058894 RepID=UPI000CE2FAC8|nr:Gfo/Idh/MocA family oxidoreductase [Arthrobacter sp. GMC3]
MLRESSIQSREATQQFRVLVVGVGNRSGLALEVARAARGLVVAIADPDPSAHKRAKLTFGDDVACFTDHKDAIAAGGIDVAFVSSPDDTHAVIANDLLRAGIAVYLEKPMAIDIEDADSVLDAAIESGTKLYVGHNMRHMPVVRTMREIIQRGEIGEVKAIWCRHFVGNGGDYYFRDWHAERARSFGLLLQKGAHDLDVIHWLAGGRTERVVAMGGSTLYDQTGTRRSASDSDFIPHPTLKLWPPTAQTDLNPVIDVEDLSMVLMDLDNGVFASYQQCHYTPDYWRNYTVIGTEGRIENFGDAAGAVIRLWNTRSNYSAQGDREYPVEGTGAAHEEADVATVKEFLDFVEFDASTDVSSVYARDAVAVAVEATLSIRDNSRPRNVDAYQATRQTMESHNF